MSLLAYGVSHQTASVASRERFAFNANSATEALRELIELPAVNEAVLLSTCNRTEIYTTAATDSAAQTLQAWLLDHHIEPSNNQDYYQYQDIQAVRHLMRVASGLDSMVLGETQIMSQIKKAFDLATVVGTVGHAFHQLFPAVLQVGKQVRHETPISVNTVSLACLGVQLAQQFFADIASRRFLLVGAGETIARVAMHLHKHGVQNVVIANRSLSRAEKLAQHYQYTATDLNTLPTCLAQADIVVSATASSSPLIYPELLADVKHQQMMIDLAVPRDIDPNIKSIDHVHLVDLDDLQNIINNNHQHRQQAAQQAEMIIDQQANHFMRQLKITNARDIICQFREHTETLRDGELKKALSYLENHADPKSALEYLARNLTNKFMHQPTIKLRQAAYYDKTELLLLLKDLFS